MISKNLRAAVAVLMLCAPAAADAAVRISFGGSGVGSFCRQGMGCGLPTSNGLSGNVSFDTALATPFGSGLRFQSSGEDFRSVQNEVTATVMGDTLLLSLGEFIIRPDAGLIIRETAFLNIVFRDGFLNNTFPTEASFSDVVSSSYTSDYFEEMRRFVSDSSTGTLNRLSITFLDRSPPFGTVSLDIVSATTPAVPEPATWAMMLVGFDAVGYSLRKQRRKTTVSYA